MTASAPLASLRVIEFESLGPAPFCGMHLADLGAEVILVERPQGGDPGPAAIFRRGKRSVVLDLKSPPGLAAALALAARADAVIEGMRPGVMERLGLGPSALQALNPAIVFGRMTGWGQSGPRAPFAGHDLNYVSLAGAAWSAGAPGDDGAPADPLPPPTLVGDVGAGALYLAVGILAAVIRARETGVGAVVDAAIVDGAAHMSALLMSLRAATGGTDRRGGSMLDGAPYYRVYQCSDGDWISVACVEPQFYKAFLDGLGLSPDDPLRIQNVLSSWPANRARLASILAEEPRAVWLARFEGTDACVAPVLSPGQAALDPHIEARRLYRDVGGVLQGAAAPRFDGADPADPPAPRSRGADTAAVLREAGLSEADIAALTSAR